MRHFVLGLLLLGAACGGDAAVTAPAAGTPNTPAPTTFPGITAALTINPFSLPAYAVSLPAYYDGPVLAAGDNTPTGNPITNAGATLGRVLFFDTRLSTTNTVSCAGCHLQANGFTDTARFSGGVVPGAVTSAHAMRLANARFYGGLSFFWDRRAATLEAQTTQPIQNAVEMGFDAAHGGMDSLLRRMRTLAYYPELFTLAFGDTAITELRIQRALAQYVRSMVSTGSRWDSGYAQVYNAADPNRGLNTPIPGFSAEEERGRQLFMSPPQGGGLGCAGCHVPPTFALAANSRSNGLDAGETTVFKSPSLKNVAVSGPYMHDGRFATLEQVIDHYATGIQDGPALDNRLRPGGQVQRIPVTLSDRAALVAFMRTLTDRTVTGDSRFTSPFKP